MQENYSFFYPIKYMRSWLTDDFGMDNRSVPLQFAMYTAMCGSLGIGTNLNETSEEKKEIIKDYVDVYKRIREVVQFGDLYRLKSFTRDEIHAVQYVKNERSVVFVFLDHEQYGKKYYCLTLRGLDQDKNYRIRMNGSEQVKNGGYLMNKGIYVELKGDYDSLLMELEEV